MLSASTLTGAQSPDRMVTVSGSRFGFGVQAGVKQTSRWSVLEAGAGQGVNNWQAVQASVAAFARVCSYDRPGSGDSQPYPVGFRAVDHASLVRAMLHAASQPPPYVLVGHSLGGIIKRPVRDGVSGGHQGNGARRLVTEDQERRMLPIIGPPPPKEDPANPPPGVPPPPPPGLRFEDFAAEFDRRRSAATCRWSC